ncbi:MAG: hypothetical protein A2Y25_09135 [Candidatus Melainabacteria bacterium GWF2_37_15]|nr:MAG: hypothetical protein A2Y25_09135 [Candidatus Melainabacteria bacterium GWF2_37_15]
MNKQKGQNLIEVVLIIPLLLVIILGILEYALFQRNVSAVQDIATEAAIAASKQYVSENACSVATPPAWCAEGAAYDTTENPATEAALALVERRLGSLGVSDIVFDYNADIGLSFGQRPFALYEFNSTKTVEYKGNPVPLVTFTLDYRDPTTNGVSTQLIYHYNLVLFGMEFSIPGVNQGRTITIIPRNVQLSSTQTKQYVHY